MKDDLIWYVFVVLLLLAGSIILLVTTANLNAPAVMEHEGAVILDKVVISDEEMAFQSRRDAHRASRSRTYNFEVSETEEAFHEAPTEKEPPVQQARTTAPTEQPVASNGLAEPVPPGGNSVWDSLAACESTSRWNLDSGNGYYGGLQFSLRSWEWVGGTGYPHEHSREHQIALAQRLLERQGWSAWPACSRKLGLR